mgnify:CR=1 FL=1
MYFSILSIGPMQSHEDDIGRLTDRNHIGAEEGLGLILTPGTDGRNIGRGFGDILHLDRGLLRPVEDAADIALRIPIAHEDVQKQNLMSLAVDAAVYYKEHYKEAGYLESLEAKRKEVEKGIANLMKAIEGGALSDTLIERLNQLEEQKASLNDAIQAENVKVSLYEDEHSVKAYFEKFLHADFDNPETRDMILEYFVDKIYLYDDKVILTCKYSDADYEVDWEDFQKAKKVASGKVRPCRGQLHQGSGSSNDLDPVTFSLYYSWQLNAL